MKKIKLSIMALSMSLVLILTLPCFIQTTQASYAKEVKQRYTQLLRLEKFKEYDFSAVDLDQDGIKELLVLWYKKPALVPYGIFTYYKGEIVSLQDMMDSYCGNSSAIYYDKKNRYLIGNNSGSREYYCRYRISKGKGKLVDIYGVEWISHDTSKGTGCYIHEVDKNGDTTDKRKRISEKKFRKYINNLVELKRRKNTKKNRKKYL